jgi:hypothetical protein
MLLWVIGVPVLVMRVLNLVIGMPIPVIGMLVRVIGVLVPAMRVDNLAAFFGIQTTQNCKQ